MTASPPTRWIAGCMTGTSLDGLDVVLAEVRGHGLALTAHYRGMVTKPLGDLREELRHFATGQPTEPLRYLRAARRLGELHAEAVAEVWKEKSEERRAKSEGRRRKGEERQATDAGTPSAGATPSCAPRSSLLAPRPSLSFVVAHGQTIWHAPGEGLSWQLFDPWPIVRRLGVPVCYDLRQADLVAGGQGAPITPLADWVLYRDPHRTRAVVNLGGIANITVLPAGGEPAGGSEGVSAGVARAPPEGRSLRRSARAVVRPAHGQTSADSSLPVAPTAYTLPGVSGGDAGPCNLLLDGLARRLFRVPYDADGRLAERGRPLPAVRQAIAAEVQRRLAPAPGAGPRSLGRENFGEDFLDAVLAVVAHEDDEDKETVLCSAAAVVADLVARRLPANEQIEMVLAGGGARNPVLVDHLRARCHDVGKDLVLSSDLGIPLEAREALGFAVLGALAQDGVPITLPAVTGATNPGRAGAWAYP